MPTLTRWFLRTALVHLVAALALGVAVALPQSSVMFYPAVLHLLVVGWVTQTIFGVAWWMFPRPGPGRSPGPAAAGWTCYLGLNAGLVLRLWAEPASLTGRPAAVAAVMASGLLQVVAVGAIVPVLWRRVGRA